jgi:hypothetical protein
MDSNPLVDLMLRNDILQVITLSKALGRFTLRRTFENGPNLCLD